MANEQVIRLGTQYEDALKELKKSLSQDQEENSPSGEEPKSAGEIKTGTTAKES